MRIRRQEIRLQTGIVQRFKAQRPDDGRYSIGVGTHEKSREGDDELFAEDHLYDRKNDPYEINNLIHDPAYTDIVRAMKERVLENWPY